MSDFCGIDRERIFRTVYEIQGVKHAVVAPAALDACADRIARDMAAIGLRVREQRFLVEGFGHEFRNIEGSLGPVDREAAAVIVAHYDTVATTPGANDDATGIAAMLEVARALAALPSPPPAYFVAVTLEEGNPALDAAERRSALERGILDERGRFRGWALSQAAKGVRDAARGSWMAGMAYGDAWRKALADAGAHLPAVLRSWFEELIPFHEGVTTANASGLLNRIGSDRWVREALAAGKRLAFNITLDEIGTCRHEEGSQGSLGGLDVYQFLSDSHRVEPARRAGDFSLVLSNASSGSFGDLFMAKARLPGIDLPAGHVRSPMDYGQIAASLPMALQSDHASFWRHGVPAIFVFDTANARNPFCHSMADTVEAVDFDRVRDIARAVAATVADRHAWSR